MFLTWRSGSALILSCTADGSYYLPRADVRIGLQRSRNFVQRFLVDGFVGEKRDGTAGKD